MILVNVLLFVALASAVLLLMISAEEGGLHRSTRLLDAARARAVALGGETSAVVALRRDALAAPDTDNATEPWARLAAHQAPIRGGTFDLEIEDAEDKLNVNLLMRNDPAVLALAARLAEAVGLQPQAVAQTADYVRLAGPVDDLSVLDAAGLPPKRAARLRGLLTALPYETGVNMNSVGEELLGILLGDPVAAHALISLRQRQGFLRPEDFLLLHVSVPPLGDFVSNTWRVRTTARIGDTTQTLVSLLHRRREGRYAVVVPFRRLWQPAAAPPKS